jgi:hypothetical protein
MFLELINHSYIVCKMSILYPHHFSNDIRRDFPSRGVILFFVDRFLTGEILEGIFFVKWDGERKIRYSIKVMRISIAAVGKARYHIRRCPYVV